MKKLFSKTLILTPEDSRTNVLLLFGVDEDMEALEIHCHYSPKYEEDPVIVQRVIEESRKKYMLAEEEKPKDRVLKNLVTLSLDQGQDYIGAAHQQAPDQVIIISPAFSSPGFVRTAVNKGDWRAVLNVHALVSPKVTYTLTVYGREYSHDRV